MPTSGWRGEGDDVVTELSASTGAVTKIISGSTTIRRPRPIASFGAHIWVVNAGGSVTELSAASGALTRVIRGAAYGFEPQSVRHRQGRNHLGARDHGQSVTEFPVT